jgi:hypothetical protein
MSSEPNKDAHRLTLHSRENQRARSSTRVEGTSSGVADGGVPIAGEASVASGISIAVGVKVTGGVVVLA